MKKGFTIAEMLGVVIILCIIAILAFPPILNLVRGTEQELDEANKELVIIASTTYVTTHSSDFPKTLNSNYYVYVDDLVKENLLSNNLVENSILELDSCVKVSVNNDYKYEYNIEVKCSEKKE